MEHITNVLVYSNRCEVLDSHVFTVGDKGFPHIRLKFLYMFGAETLQNKELELKYILPDRSYKIENVNISEKDEVLFPIHYSVFVNGGWTTLKVSIIEGANRITLDDIIIKTKKLELEQEFKDPKIEKLVQAEVVAKTKEIKEEGEKQKKEIELFKTKVLEEIENKRKTLKGDKGNGIIAATIIENNKVRFIYDNGEYLDVTIPTVKGPKGEQGIQGERGPQGVKGDKGDTPEIKTNNNPLLGKSDTLATTRATYSIIVGDGLYTHQQIAGGYTGNGGKQPPSYVGLGRVRFLMSNEVIGSDGNYKDFMYMNTYEGSDVPSTTAFGINRVGSFDAFIMRSNSDRTLWQEKGRLWHSENFNPDNKLNKINKDNFEGFENGNVGLYIGTNNEVNFATIYEDLYFNYRQMPGSKKIKSITICNGESTGGRGDLYCGNLGVVGNGVFTGNLTVQGEIVCNNNITAYSDIRLKSNIKKIDNALEKVCKINGYTFDINNKRGTGVIAQELQEILPEVVIETDTEEKYLSVAYGNIVGLLIEAIKDLKAEIEVLKNDKK